MEVIIEEELNKDIFTDDYEYFFTFLTDRFEYAVDLWVKELEKKFNKKFKPIWILSAKQNELFKKENYIILNKRLKEIEQKSQKNKVIYLEDYEDINKEFSESEKIRNLINKLVDKQGRVFILGFTSSFLDLKNNKAILLGPNNKLATQLDNKVEHIKLFEKLDLPRNKTRIYRSIQEIKEKEKYPFYISASYSSGGHESDIIYNEGDVNEFFTKLRELNKTNSFLVADLITEIKCSPNVNAVICNTKDTKIICISDQILRGNQYLGNIYPSKITDKEKEIIIETTKKVGNHLSNLGFRGLFGLDFIIDSTGKVFCIDLNPRRQGGYLCNLLMSKKINIPRVELNLALGEDVPKFSENDFQVDYHWAHCKIKPYNKEVQILNIFKTGKCTDPFLNLKSNFECIFYPVNTIFNGGCVGYYIASGTSREEVLSSLFERVEKILSKDLGLYLL